ncbi:MAG: aspartate carbamoyltransferase catalytic subunit [Dehalococcoidia bacterium]|nr:aspartate carbamoyltransferase catalytic subunit [Dehalococcoidia bacterium]
MSGKETVSQAGESVAWRHHHVLDVDDFSTAEIELVMQTADAMKDVLSRPIRKVPALRGKTVFTVFYEASTRTRGSFEAAAKNLSADVVNITAQSSSVTKGESLIDTLNTLEAIGADIIVMRHPLSGAHYCAAPYVKANLLNAGDGWHAHPTQALLDLYTMRRHKMSVNGLKVAIVGDIKHSRVAHSNIWCLSKMGAKVTLCAPPTLLPAGMDDPQGRFPDVNVTTDINAALQDADVVMCLRLQKERMQSGLLPGLREFTSGYQLNKERLALAKPDAIVMHPGPVNEDVELAGDVLHGPRSMVNEQVANGVAVRMALLYLLSGSKEL